MFDHKKYNSLSRLKEAPRWLDHPFREIRIKLPGKDEIVFHLLMAVIAALVVEAIKLLLEKTLA